MDENYLFFYVWTARQVANPMVSQAVSPAPHLPASTPTFAKARPRQPLP